MKNLILILAILLVSPLFSRDIDDILNQKETKKFRYRLKTGLLEAIVINMSFGNSEVISSTNRTRLKNANIVQVDLVYSDFPKQYDVKELNKRRIITLQNLRADLVSSSSINWRLIRQMECANEAEAKTMFHGIVILFIPEQTKEVTKEDIAFYKSYLPTDDLKFDAKKARRALPDSTIFKVFERKKAWHDMLIVSDITGSMSPYTAQLILWFKLKMNDHRIRNVVFFNDGDMKSTSQKRIGSTGGIYESTVSDYEEIRNLALKASANGHGGDGPENDLEAMLYAQEKFKNLKEIILIADNYSAMRDYELVKKLKVPVRVILCGTAFGVNVAYLNLARETGGSVHTIEKDLENLKELNEGKKFTLGQCLFKIENGIIVEIKRN